MSLPEAKRRKTDDVVEIIDIEESEDRATPTPITNFKCPICLDTPEVLVATECGHLYCENCVFHAIRSSRNSTKVSGQCSICRKTIKYSSVKYLELRLAGQGSTKKPSTKTRKTKQTSPAPLPEEKPVEDPPEEKD